MAVAVVERFKREAMYGLSVRTKKVAVSGGSTVYEMNFNLNCKILI